MLNRVFRRDKCRRVRLLVWLTMLVPVCAQAEADPNFYIYLCFGQSNMEGNAPAEAVDKTSIGHRFQMLATTDFDNPSRQAGQWYAAVPPIVSPIAGLGMADYFGRTMAAALPAQVTVGVVDVAIGGCAIEMFDKDKYQTQLTDPGNWSAQLANRYYGGNPYQRLVDMARRAQQKGVIKGILLHQGESNNTQQDWPQKVKKIYEDLLADLGLGADSVPLFAGELLRQEFGGVCWGHNSVIARLPQVIPTAHVISSEGCEGNGKDPWHFCAMSYRLMGRRYAFEALRLMGRELMADPDYVMPTSMKKFFCVQKIDLPAELVAVPGQRIGVKATFQDGHVEDVTADMVYACDEVPFAGGCVASTAGDADGTVVATYTDFSRKQTRATMQLKVRRFPLDERCMRTLIGQGTLNSEERTLQLQAGAEMGWVYDGGMDLSGYKYLVIQLAEKQTCAAQLRLYGQTEDFSQNYALSAFGSKTTVGVKLDGLRVGSRKLAASDIRAIGFYAAREGALRIADIYLTNNDDFTPDAMTPVRADATGARCPVFNLSGARVGTASDWSRLPGGAYVTGGRVVLK